MERVDRPANDDEVEVLILPFGITTLLFACADTAYEPCAGKMAGDQCQLCAPDNPDCVETMMIIKTCGGDGRCSAQRKDGG